MIPKAGLSGAFYKIRNDDALLSKATSNLADQLNYLQNIEAGAQAYLELNGTVSLGNLQNLMDDPQSEPFGKTYSWSDTEIDANYLSEDVDVDAVIEHIQSNPKFKAFRSYINEGSDQILDVIPYVRENGVSDEDERTVSSVNIGIKMRADSRGDFDAGFKAFKEWESSNKRDNFNPTVLDDSKGFSLFLPD